MSNDGVVTSAAKAGGLRARLFRKAVSESKGLNKIWFVAKTDSMSPLLCPGDRFRVVQARAEECQIGDLLLYQVDDTLCVHRVWQVKKTGAQWHLITKGDVCLYSDAPKLADEVCGVVTQVFKPNSQEPKSASLRWRLLDSLIRKHAMAFSGIYFPLCEAYQGKVSVAQYEANRLERIAMQTQRLAKKMLFLVLFKVPVRLLDSWIMRVLV